MYALEVLCMYITEKTYTLAYTLHRHTQNPHHYNQLITDATHLLSTIHKDKIVLSCFFLIKVAFHFSVLAGQKELVLTSLSWKDQGARAYIFPATTLQIPALWPTGAGERP